METNISMIAGTFGMRTPGVALSGLKPWPLTRPIALAGLPVTTAPDARRISAELCPSPDRFPVTQSHFYAQAFGGAAARGDVPTSTGSHRQAPPG